VVVDTAITSHVPYAAFEAGGTFETLGRTVTEADVVGFAGVTDDWNPHHVNQHWAQANSPFGQRIAHGMLVTAIAGGMLPPHLRPRDRLCSISGVFKKPVLIGQTIKVIGRAATTASVPLPIELRVVNQQGELAAKLKLSFQATEPLAAADGWDGDVADSVSITAHDLASGQPYRSPGRTITDGHVVQYAAITGDWDPAHADAEWTREHNGGQRTAHELLVLGTSIGMMPIDVPNLVAARKCEAGFHRPVALGDTIHVEGRLTDRQPAGDQLIQDHFEVRTVNQRGESVLSYRMGLVMRPGD
jgi:acyl dehydratase